MKYLGGVVFYHCPLLLNYLWDFWSPRPWSGQPPKYIRGWVKDLIFNPGRL